MVGASGTGSIVAALFVRAGAHNLVLLDDDTVEDVNLNRILNTRTDDIGAYKVDILKQRLEATGLGCHVTALHASVLTAEGLEELRDADVVFGCVDNQALPRLALSHYAHQYLRPVIDVGSEIGTDQHGTVISLDARTSYTAPGRACLRCQGLVDPDRLAHETLAQGERERVRQQGYAEHLYLAQPAVMELNMRAASLGTLLLRHLLQPVLAPLPLTFLEDLVMFTRRRITTPRAPHPDCDICQRNPNFAVGPHEREGLHALIHGLRPPPAGPSQPEPLPGPRPRPRPTLRPG